VCITIRYAISFDIKRIETDDEIPHRERRRVNGKGSLTENKSVTVNKLKAILGTP